MSTDVDRLRRMLARSTPLPWVQGGPGRDAAIWCVIRQLEEIGEFGRPKLTAVCSCSMSLRDFQEDIANAELIASAISDLPSMLDEIEDLRRRLLYGPCTGRGCPRSRLRQPQTPRPWPRRRAAAA